MNRRVTVFSKVKAYKTAGAVAKASLIRAIKLDEVDPKRSDLPMVSAKLG